MRVVFSTSFADAVRSMSSAADNLLEAQRQVASGRRVSRPSQDPLGTAAAITEHGVQDRLDAYSSTADGATYRLSIADSVLSDVISQLTSAQTTALAARGSSQNQSQRDAAGHELLSIRDALLGDVNTRFQGTYLFGGSNVTVAPYAVSGPGFTGYQGDSAPTRLEIETGRTVASTFDGGSIFQGTDPAHVLDVLTTLAADVVAGNSSGIAAGVDALQRAFDRATTAQAEVGNDLKLIDDSRVRRSAEQTGVVARLATLEDVDLAEAMSKLTQSETAYRSALTSISTVGKLTLMDYL
jgi:flagellar hook-associated protein 3 FlgL